MFNTKWNLQCSTRGCGFVSRNLGGIRLYTYPLPSDTASQSIGERTRRPPSTLGGESQRSTSEPHRRFRTTVDYLAILQKLEKVARISLETARHTFSLLNLFKPHLPATATFCHQMKIKSTPQPKFLVAECCLLLQLGSNQ